MAIWERYAAMAPSEPIYIEEVQQAEAAWRVRCLRSKCNFSESIYSATAIALISRGWREHMWVDGGLYYHPYDSTSHPECSHCPDCGWKEEKKHAPYCEIARETGAPMRRATPP